MKMNLKTAFAVTTAGLYGFNEVAQKLHQGMIKLSHQGIDMPYLSLYQNMPFAGDFVRNYASSFFGAAICGVTHKMVSEYMLSKVSDSLSQKYNKVSTEVATLTSAGLLTVYENTIGMHNYFDWNDMMAYGLALAMFYGVYKIAEEKPSTPNYKNLGSGESLSKVSLDQ